ncbi:hypothetical protein D3C76_1677630 [compost metagenome]
MGNEMPVVGQYALSVLHVVLHRGVRGVASVFHQEAMVALDHGHGVSHPGGSAADQAPAVQGGVKH